jgi:hypothetical protein
MPNQECISMKTENEQEHCNAPEPKNGGGKHHHGHGDLAQLEEKIEHVIEEVHEIEELIEAEEHKEHHHPKHYFVEIEGVEYPWSEDTITVPEIRRLGNLPPDQPVIEIDPDNQERTLAEGEVVYLKPGHRYGKKVRYKRGLQARITAELELLRRFYPAAEWHPLGANGWIKIPEYRFPAIWNRETDTICFEVPAPYPGQAPYGFFVTAGLRTKESGAVPQSYQEGVATPFSGTWGKFSWADDGTWRPTADTSVGSNLTNFVLTFAKRLREGA